MQGHVGNESSCAVVHHERERDIDARALIIPVPRLVPAPTKGRRTCTRYWTANEESAPDLHAPVVYPPERLPVVRRQRANSTATGRREASGLQARRG